MNSKAFVGLMLFCLSATATARDLTPEQKAALCKIQSTVKQLRAIYDDRGGVVVTWQRINPGALLQHRLPPRSYPIETRIALDGDAMKGRTIENAWYDALNTADRPQWFFPLVPPGEHTVSVAQKNECGEWNTDAVAVTSDEDERSGDDDVAGQDVGHDESSRRVDNGGWWIRRRRLAAWRREQRCAVPAAIGQRTVGIGERQQ